MSIATLAEPVLAAVVDASYITASASSAQAFKTATLLKTLNVNALITGEPGVGKKSLASYILPESPLLEAYDYEQILATLECVNAIIIANIENSPNLKSLLQAAASSKVRVIATAGNSYKNQEIDKFFSIQFEVPPLSKRPEDVTVLIQRFVKEAALLFASKDDFVLQNFTPDLSQNANSLRRQIMINYLLQDINENELMEIVQNYVLEKLGSNNDYKNLLHLYEVPMIRAGLQRFKSQLKISEKFGLNRNTLRKKIIENHKYLYTKEAT